MKFTSPSGKRKGFTIIEILIVASVLSVLMAISTPIFLSAISDAANKQCRANMQAICNSEEQYRTKSSTHSYTTTLSQLPGTTLAVPVCPANGTYLAIIADGSQHTQDCVAIPVGNLIVTCSSHGLFAPNVDSR